MTVPKDDRYLEGRVALVTGGARGIGRAIAADFIKHGAKVVIVDNGGEIDGSAPDSSVVDSVASSLGEQAIGCFLDIGSIDSAQQAVTTALENWGRLDLVINNAAILRDHFIFKAKPSDFEEVIRVNLSGAYYVLAAATPILREQAKNAPADDPYTWGRVVNIVSTAGFYGNYGQSSYAGAKSGLMGLTRAAALDLLRSGIHVNALAPFARSRVTDMIVPANEEQKVYKERAVQVKPENVATVVTALCSDFGKGITGQLFGVRGRQVMLFSQPRPICQAIIDEQHWNPTSVADVLQRQMKPEFTELLSDLEEFNTEPAI